MKTIFIFLTAMLIELNCLAQSPGYMGKKASFYYTPAIFLSMNDGGEWGHYAGINYRHDFSFDYAVTKSSAVGCSFKYISTKMRDVTYFSDYNPQGNQYAFYGDLKLHGPAFSVYLKKFAFSKRGYIAPVGYYTKLEFCIASVNTETKEGRIPSSPENYIYVNRFEDLNFETNHAMAGFIYSFGRQSLYFDGLFITTGGSLGFMFPTGLTGGGPGSGYYGDETQFQFDSEFRVSSYFLFNINIGIGLLAL